MPWGSPDLQEVSLGIFVSLPWLLCKAWDWEMSASRTELIKISFSDTFFQSQILSKLGEENFFSINWYLKGSIYNIFQLNLKILFFKLKRYCIKYECHGRNLRSVTDGKKWHHLQGSSTGPRGNHEHLEWSGLHSPMDT